MKIGLLMAGISYGYKSDRDFRHCFPNIFKNLIEPLQEFHEVNCYITTYDHHLMDGLKDLYKPVSVNIIPYEGATQLSTRSSSIDSVDNEDLDFYFVHSFKFHLNDSSLLVASSEYGESIPSIINKENLFGVQFHPEKSQVAGKKLAINFLKIK